MFVCDTHGTAFKTYKDPNVEQRVERLRKQVREDFAETKKSFNEGEAD